MDSSELYTRLGQLVGEMPDLEKAPTQETRKWIARAHALVDESGSIVDAAAIAAQTPYLEISAGRALSASTITGAVLRAFAAAELKAPAASQGAFIAAGNPFDALREIGKVLASANNDLLIVDPYLDEKVLTEFSGFAREHVLVRLLTDAQGMKPTLETAYKKWGEQYKELRPVALGVCDPKTLHDRIIIADGERAWILTQSIKDFASKSPASIVNIDAELTGLKISAYEALWRASKRL
jgi:hypothetical protein